MSRTEIQYVLDGDGNQVKVIVPIELWREIESERETAYLLQSETMKRRLLEAKERTNGIPMEDILRLAAQVYDGLSEQDVNEVEQIALDRSAFFK